MKQKNIDFNVYTDQIHNKYVWCDGKNLNRVLLNIISNAFKFTPAGGTIKVSLWEVGAGEHGYGSYEMRIQDSGIGMSKEFAERMFNAFERERTSTVSGIEGTGLGLAITKSIVDLMGGTIDVLTAPGNGTEMIIRLKLQLAEEKDMQKSQGALEANDEAAIDYTTKRLLLVEDNFINMEIAKEILLQIGFQVETAENGKMAVDMIENAEAGYYDLVLMDIQMPVMDGYEATRIIRNKVKGGSEIPIIALSANAFEQDKMNSIKAGMNAHVSKPVNADVLCEVIKTHLVPIRFD